MASIVYTGILLASFLFLIWKKDETESNFPLKIIGYFVLGSFAFHFNQIALPIGFIVYLLFLHPKLNVNVKRIAAFLGVIAFILIQWILPYAIYEWESRPISIDHELGSVYTMNFQDEQELIKHELNLKNNNLGLEDFEVEYMKNGRMKDLSWQLIAQNGNGYKHYRLQYDFDNSRYQVTSNQLDAWPQYNRLIDADRFFEILNLLDIKDITHAKGDFSSYVMRSSGEQTNYGIEDGTHFILSNGKIKLLDNKQLPVEAYYISTFAMKKTGEERDNQGNVTQESFEGTESSDYLFDAKFGEE